MSYILEALKKSEQERQQGRVPGLQTLPPQLHDTVQPAKWPYAVIGVLALSLVFMLGWMRPWARQDKLAGIQHSGIAQETAQAVPDQSSPPVSVLITEPTASSVKPAIVQKPVLEEPSLSLESIPHLRDIPSLVQQAIPDMEFAGHVYTSNPEQRSVIINGRSMAEGETVVEGLKVEQITKAGVVFSYQTQLFQMPILQDWAFD